MIINSFLGPTVVTKKEGGGGWGGVGEAGIQAFEA